MNPKIKENLLLSILAVGILVALFFWVRSVERSAPQTKPLPLESRYDLNILSKKYGIPLDVAKNINKSAIRIKNENGASDWQASIEKISKETGIPETVIASFLGDQELMSQKSTGNYSDADGSY